MTNWGVERRTRGHHGGCGKVLPVPRAVYLERQFPRRQLRPRRGRLSAGPGRAACAALSGPRRLPGLFSNDA